MYLELVRVNRAREMLRRGEPISRVAFDTGFSDQSHLTRRFKRVVGVPPGQYAKTYGSSRAGETRVA
jgi:AraC-like DNA-binding protein